MRAAIPKTEPPKINPESVAMIFETRKANVKVPRIHHQQTTFFRPLRMICFSKIGKQKTLTAGCLGPALWFHGNK